MARLADKFPRALTKLIKTIPSLRFIIGDAYMEAGKLKGKWILNFRLSLILRPFSPSWYPSGEIAFAHEPENSKVAIYAEEEAKQEAENRRLFGRVKGTKEHPLLAGGILGINCNTLREDLLPGYRSMLLENLKKSPECQVQWLWGDLDVTVPFKENFNEVKGWADENENMNLTVLNRMGHELFFEDSQVMAGKIVPFFKS